MEENVKDNLNDPLKDDILKLVSKEQEKEENKMSDYDLYEGSSFISKMIFFWVLKILFLAKRIKLEPSSFGLLSPSNDAKNYSEYLNYFWEEKNYKSKKSNALMKAVLRANIYRLIKVIVLSAISSGLQFFIILILKEYIDYFQLPKERRFTLLQLGMAFIVTQLISVFIKNHTNFTLCFVGFRAKYELNCFIYSKLLKISPSSFQSKATHGEIVNFLQVDSNKLSGLMLVSPDLVTSPLMIVAYIYLLFDFFGLSFLAGIGVLLIFFVFFYLLYDYYAKIAEEMLQKKDSRMKLTTEILDSIKVLKLYNWENTFQEKVIEAREEEVRTGKKGLLVATSNISLFWLCPVCVAIGTIGVYIYLNNSFNISTMLIGLALFTKLQSPVRDLPWSINAVLETLISMRRIEKFLRQQEYVNSNVIYEDKNEKPYSIKIEKGTFTWGKKPVKEESKKENNKDNENKKDNKLDIIINDKSSSEEKTIDKIKEKILSEDDSNINLLISESSISQKRDKENIIINSNQEELIPDTEKENDYDIVLSDINVEIKQGETVGIIGEVGSGKTSLLQAILNSLILLSGDKCDGIHLTGSLGYVSQTPWIQNESIRNNILFFQKYDEEKYQKVLELSQLKYDLNNLEGKDLTEIGENGINLSGGQKVRVSLARSLYHNPDIYLFDDPISALDANIGRKVMDDCIMKYLKNKTKLIATHALYFLKDMDKIIYMHQGRIDWMGTYDELINQDFFDSLAKMKKQRKESQNDYIDLTEEKEENEEEEEKGNKGEKWNPIVKKLMKEEDQEIGVVKMNIYIRYCLYMGGVCFVLMIAFVMLLWAFTKCGSDLWLAYWSKEENQDDSKKVFFFSIYSGLGLASAVFIFLRLLMLSLGVIKLSRSLHTDMLSSLIKAPINLFHEIIPRGQLINRLSRDLENLQYMIFTVGGLLVGLFSGIGSIMICSVFDYYSLIFLPFLGMIGYALTSFYLIGKRSLSRLERTSYSPILNTVSETIPGVISIKAFGKHQNYLSRFYNAVNDNFKVSLFHYGAEIWFNLQFDLLSFLFVSYLVIYTNIFEAESTAQSVGIMFTYSLVLQESLSNLFVCCANLETEMVSMERCIAYTKIDGEKPSNMAIDTKLTEDSWPQNGKIQFDNYYVKYRPNTEVVLKNLNITINPGEKIGVIGRTGSGKSTICLCLFRILEPLSGTIFIDDTDITEIGLDLLRQNITIIPQDPTIMQGTLKYNIDPFNLKSNKEILGMLREIGFNIENKEESLMKVIEEKGNNLSVGEKQLLCIARAMLRKTKIIVMDEATANIDMKTEEKIQNALKLIMNNSTIITIAHRIKTIINYDRILVLDDGKVAEFDSPDILLKNKSSLFYQLYSKSSI